MAKLFLDEIGEFEVEDGKRLVLAIEDLGVNILHRCGGNARCTTCRVEFIKGEPQKITEAEKNKWQDKGETSFRLSCQCKAEGEMKLRVINTLESTGLDDPGPTPDNNITPDPVWHTLERE